MHFHIMTLFPEMVSEGLNTSIIGRAVKAGILDIEAVDIRDFSADAHRSVDDYPYGGGAGMVMMAQPVYDCYRSIEEKILAAGREKPKVIYTSPAGKVFDQKRAIELSACSDIVILCGHYEGVDERVLEEIGAEDISIGDYVLTGGELASMVMVDAISRMVPGVLSNGQSGIDESFSSRDPSSEFTKKGRREVYGDLKDRKEITLLEYPQYTRPECFMGRNVPEVLLSGHHENIEKWRREQSIKRTMQRRPDLLEDK